MKLKSSKKKTSEIKEEIKEQKPVEEAKRSISDEAAKNSVVSEAPLVRQVGEGVSQFKKRLDAAKAKK